MRIWAIADLHLSLGVPNKTMDLFGPEWTNHAQKIAQTWDEKITTGDLVLVPGDISWAMRLDEARPDLEWLEERPGTKVLIRGNHDYWWGSKNKVKKALPPSIHIIQNDSIVINGIGITGTRLWDSPEYDFNEVIDFKPSKAPPKPYSEKDREIFTRELKRLEMGLKTLSSNTNLRIAMTHFPPIGLDLSPSACSQLLEHYGISFCLFGHLHSLKQTHLFGTARGIKYELVSCDYLNFAPLLITNY